jgi:hypothetical protein
MIQRRSRMHRTRTGKCLALTPRDLEIFRTLCRYRFLRSTYLHSFVGGESEKRFKERLGDLFHEGYLDRPTEQWRFADARCLPVVHELGKGGHEIITAASAPQPVSWLRDGPHRQFEHSLMICDVLASIELAIRQWQDMRFIAWPEILAKAPENTRQSAKPYLLSATNSEAVMPDAIFGFEYCRDGRKAYRFFALEADRGTMPIARSNKDQTSYLGKIAAYREVIGRQIHKTHLGIPNLLVLTATTDEDRMADMMTRLDNSARDSSAFLFKTVNARTLRMPAPTLLFEPWQRAGQPALNIGAPN